MTSSWIQHVKNYASKHGISYKKALTEAKASYKQGGKIETEKKGYAFDIPLFIRLLEYAREDARTDMELHDVAERVQKTDKEVLTMKDYKKLVKRSVKKGAGDLGDPTL